MLISHSSSCCLVYDLLDIAPVIEGAVQHIASRRLEIGGLDLTKLLADELSKSNPTVKLNISDVEKLKERYACCADDDIAYEKLQQSCLEEKHTLPDGQVSLHYFSAYKAPLYKVDRKPIHCIIHL